MLSRLGHQAGYMTTQEPRTRERLRVTQLSCLALVGARTASFSLIGLVLLLVAVAAPVRHAELQSMLQNLSPAQEAVLQELGLTGVLHPGVRLALEMVVIGVFVGAGLLIVASRPDDWVALHVAAREPRLAQHRQCEAVDSEHRTDNGSRKRSTSERTVHQGPWRLESA